MRFLLFCFIILCILLFAAETFFILNGSPGADYWQHAAVVKELSMHPVHPSDPVTGTAGPHAFFSPYSLLVAAFSRLTGLGPLAALKYFSFFNLAFLLFSFYRFCKVLFKELWPATAVAGLLLVLFFWGKDPWLWSGFLHFWTLDLVLSYPSSFAMALSFFILSLIIIKKEMNWPTAFLIFLFITVVILTHPTTAVILFTAMVCSQKNSFSIKHLSFLIIPVLLSLLWPYYNIIELFTGDNADFHNQSRQLYDQVFSKTWPALLVLPGLFLYKKNRVVFFLAIVTVILFVLYLAGLMSGLYGLSRLIPGVMIFAQLLIAYFIALGLEMTGSRKLIYPVAASLVMAVCLYLNRGHAIKKMQYAGADDKSHFWFLQEEIQPGDLVLSDKASNEIIPAINGKVLATSHPMYWVKDARERRNAVDLFFSDAASDSARQLIIRQYKPKYLLLNNKTIRLGKSAVDSLLKGRNTVFRNDKIRLVRL